MLYGGALRGAEECDQPSRKGASGDEEIAARVWRIAVGGTNEDTDCK